MVHRTVSIGVPLLAVLLTTAVMLAISVLGFMITERQLTDLRLSKAAAVARTVQADFDRALGYGIPLRAVEGAVPYLEGIAERNPDLRFFAITDRTGQRLYYAGMGRRRLDPLLDEMASRSAGMAPVEVSGFVVLRLPFRDGAGFLQVGVQRKQIRDHLAEDLPRGMAFILAMALVVRALMSAAVRRAVSAPLDRLLAVLEAGAAGRFRDLLGGRPRDGIGEAMLACNAAIQRLHDQRQRFILHADEVRAAVFDADVAREVEQMRGRTLEQLGDGLGAPPVRRMTPLPASGALFSVLAPAAASASVMGALSAGGLPAFETAVVAGVAGVAGIAVGAMIRNTRITAVLGAAVIAAAAGTVLLGNSGFVGMLSLLLLAAAGGGLVLGAALRLGSGGRLGGALAILFGVAQGVLIGGLLGGAVLAANPATLAVFAVALALGAFAAAVRLSAGRS